MVATAGMDGQAHIFDRAAGRIVGELQGHSKKVNGALKPPGFGKCQGLGSWWGKVASSPTAARLLQKVNDSLQGSTSFKGCSGSSRV